MSSPPNAASPAPEPTVRTIMLAVSATAAPDTTVGMAYQLMREHGVTHLPVLDGELLVGIVSRRDLLRAQSDALPLAGVMARTVFVLSPDTPMSRAARTFRERGLPVLPVVDGRKLSGLVRAVDVLETAWDRAKS